jgi:predicted glutamine amidotransferase
LFMHNGYIAELPTVKRDLMMTVDPSLYADIAGQTDTEVLFHLALTFGLENDPPDAIGRAIGVVEDVGRRHDVREPFQGTIATTDGERLWAFRYSSARQSRSLFFTGDVRTLRDLYPDQEVLRRLSDDARLVVSEPIGDLPGAWHQVPESSYGVVGMGEDRLVPFEVKQPSHAVAVGG